MAWFLKHYHHEECEAEWVGEWSCVCNDRCPVCDTEIEPYDDEDLSILTKDNVDGTWTVLISPMTAEYSPAYKVNIFSTIDEAERFAAEQRELMDDAL